MFSYVSSLPANDQAHLPGPRHELDIARKRNAARSGAAPGSAVLRYSTPDTSNAVPVNSIHSFGDGSHLESTPGSLSVRSVTGGETTVSPAQAREQFRPADLAA